MDQRTTTEGGALSPVDDDGRRGRPGL